MDASDARAVEEQAATTNEIARNVAEAVRGSAQVTENITAVAMAAKSTTSGAAGTQQEAEALARMAAGLQSLLGRSARDERPESRYRSRRDQPAHAVFDDLAARKNREPHTWIRTP